MIDFSFIQELEGNLTVGYVPDPENSISGVTVGCGFDLGCRSKSELIEAFNTELASKLTVYAGLKKMDAVSALQEKPLRLSEEETASINAYAKEQAVSRLNKAWEQSSDTKYSFDYLPSEIQTVIASVAFQYGDLARRTPRFWFQVTNDLWLDVLDNLKNFGDRYRTRRGKEADLLRSYLQESLRLI